MPNLDLSVKTKRRTTFEEREEEGFGCWSVSRDLFGDDPGSDIHDFQSDSYKYFLDNVKSLTDLVEGLRQLSPFADDALAVAEKMNEKDFTKFKQALSGERRALSDSHEEQLPLFLKLEPLTLAPKMPRKYFALLIPKQFIIAELAAEKFNVCLGVALIQIDYASADLARTCSETPR